MERITEKVLGYNVDLLSFEDAVNYVVTNLKESKGMQIVTINPEMIELANKNSNFSQILKEAELIVPDGSGIKLALKLKGIKQEQIPGIDFSKKIIEKCSEKSISIALIGAKDEIIKKTIENLKNEFNNLDIVFYRNGYFKENEEEDIINELQTANPKFVLVALGAPKQELFIKKCREKLKNSVLIGVGGSFDVWGGAVERAPQIYRIMGCEWLFRTLKQPQRIKRIYKTLPLFLFKVIIEALKSKIKR